MLLMGLAVGGFFVNLAWGMMYSFPSWRYPKELVGRAIGVSNGVGQFGAFMSPLIAGYLVVALPDNSYDFGNVFLFWSILAFVGAVAISFLREKSIIESADFEVKKTAV